MTILGHTAEYLIEGDAVAGRRDNMLTISRASDGHGVALFGPRIIGDAREAIAAYGAARAAETYIRLATYNQPEAWQPLYKPHRLRAALADPDLLRDLKR